MGWRTVVHPDDLAVCTSVQDRDEAVRNHQSWNFEYRLRRYDGEYRWHLARTLPLFDAAGVIRRWVGTATDIHDDKETTIKQRRFIREVLASVTDGGLRLCDSEADLPMPLSNIPLGEAPFTLSKESLRTFRQLVIAACEGVGLSPERTADLALAAGEAAMNAVVHGGEFAEGRVYILRASDTNKISTGNGAVQVWISDGGGGIAEDSLHRATLERGFSSAGTLGHGFPLMLSTTNRVYLLTGSGGTSVVLEQEEVTSELSHWQRHSR